MNRISLFILLVLVYLGLSKSFAPSERNTPYLVNDQVFASFFTGAPLSVVLTDRLQTGFLIKTHFLELRLVQGFKLPETILVRTSHDFWKKNAGNIGMSLFRRDEKEGRTNTIPQPPGAIFLGDPSYGHWEQVSSGQKEWHFYNAYKYFPEYLAWGDYRPTEEFWRNLKLHLSNEETYYGDNKEFGTDGKVTSVALPQETKVKNISDVDFRTHMKKFFRLPRLIGERN